MTMARGLQSRRRLDYAFKGVFLPCAGRRERKTVVFLGRARSALLSGMDIKPRDRSPVKRLCPWLTSSPKKDVSEGASTSIFWGDYRPL